MKAPIPRPQSFSYVKGCKFNVSSAAAKHTCRWHVARGAKAQVTRRHPFIWERQANHSVRTMGQIPRPRHCFALLPPCRNIALASRILQAAKPDRLFAQDGCGGPAQPTGKRCVLCCVEALHRTLSSRVGKGNLQRLLKHWRCIKSPVYEAAFELGSLCALSVGEQHLLRAKAGEESKLEKRNSWLHKKKQRLRNFLRGKPIPAASPRISEGSRKYSKDAACRDSKGWRQHWIYLQYRKQEPFANIKTNCKRRTYWRGKPAIVRGKRRAWWKVRRALKAKYFNSMAAGPPFHDASLKWAMEEGLLQAGTMVPLSMGIAYRRKPRWCFLTDAGDSLYFEGLEDRLDFQTQQLLSAEASVNNALAKTELVIDASETSSLLTERGYDWYQHMLSHDQVIFSSLYVSNMLAATPAQRRQLANKSQGTATDPWYAREKSQGVLGRTEIF